MKSILLAEDDPFISDIYLTQLKKDGFKVNLAKDGQMALEKVQAYRPDLLILDINLPKLDGWEVLRRLRKNPDLKGTRVIILSNLNHKEYADDAPSLGVLKYFLKVQTPPEEITHAIKEILK